MASRTLTHHQSHQSHANLLSALNAFMQSCQVQDAHAIGSILRISFYRNRTAHAATLQKQGKTAAYIANRKTYLAQWSRLVRDLDREYAAANGQVSPFAQALREIFSNGISKKQVAAQACVSLASLNRWLAGRKPNEKARPSLLRLERFFGMVPGELVALSGLDARASIALSKQEGPKIRYRERLRDQVTEAYGLHNVHAALKQEWLAFVQYKTAVITHSKARQKNGKWNTTTERVVPHSDKNWYAFCSRGYVATASIQWGYISRYLGWLCWPIERGGCSLQLDDVQTLAHLANTGYLERYIEWRIERAEGVVNGTIIAFLKIVRSMCHPKTGYLCNTPHFAQVLGLPVEAWKERCAEAFDFVKESLNILMGQCEQSRNSFEPLQSILELKNPLEGVADAIQRMNAARPSTGGMEEAIWARDRLLLKLLASNPLRAKNLKLLKVAEGSSGNALSADGTGCLYRDRDGGWRIAIPRKVFKNFAGAAKDRDYDMPVEKSVWADIDNYLIHYRPLIAATDNPYLFTSSRDTTSLQPMYGLNRRIEILTRKYFWNCPGVGPHGFRHIVATAILKQSPNDWQTAALVLHDRIETVEKHYAHLRSNDGAERQFAILASSYSRM